MLLSPSPATSTFSLLNGRRCASGRTRRAPTLRRRRSAGGRRPPPRAPCHRHWASQPVPIGSRALPLTVSAHAQSPVRVGSPCVLCGLQVGKATTSFGRLATGTNTTTATHRAFGHGYPEVARPRRYDDFQPALLHIDCGKTLPHHRHTSPLLQQDRTTPTRRADQERRGGAVTVQPLFCWAL